MTSAEVTIQRSFQHETYNTTQDNSRGLQFIHPLGSLVDAHDHSPSDSATTGSISSQEAALDKTAFGTPYNRELSIHSNKGPLLHGLAWM
jgi:hypothetical protein